MDVFLSKVTQQAMNYAIRSGIAITSTYAIKQCARLVKNVNSRERDELQILQLKLESKIRIISPAIDMIELIAARGNTSLDSAVTLTKSIRWNIQALGMRLARVAAEEEIARKTGSKTKTQAETDVKVNFIISDIRKLLEQIEDAVPLINLAITTSGVNLSTTVPSSVSPSRLLQASAFLAAGDRAYGAATDVPMQIGPRFMLSVYMLFAGHANRPHDDEGIRETTWKEVVHKAHVKLLRVPLDKLYELPPATGDQLSKSSFGDLPQPDESFTAGSIPSDGKAHEFAYQLLVVEDLDDDRVHTFDEGEERPEPFDEVSAAGVREIIPIHEISKIFYADTGKILNIGTEGETNNPVLLLKRDVHAIPPRRMMHENKSGSNTPVDEEVQPGAPALEQDNGEEDDEASNQLRRESSVHLADSLPATPVKGYQQHHRQWSFPIDLDPEWIAFEVYNETSDSDSEEDTDISLTQSSPPSTSKSPSIDPITSAFSRLLHSPSASSKPSTPTGTKNFTEFLPSGNVQSSNNASNGAPLPGPLLSTPSIPRLQTSLSLLELLIRLTALQQFQQMSHLAITDELLNFFLSEASTTGAGPDAQSRKNVRRYARQRLGFDPYDESPIRRHGEEYLRQYSSGGGYEDGDGGEDGVELPEHEQEWDEPGKAIWSSPRLPRRGDLLRPGPGPSYSSPPPPSYPRRVMGAGVSPRAHPLSSPTPRSSSGMRPPVGRVDSTGVWGGGSAVRKNGRAAGLGLGRSPLGRSESDSTLGTSPRTEGLDALGG